VELQLQQEGELVQHAFRRLVAGAGACLQQQQEYLQQSQLAAASGAMAGGAAMRGVGAPCLQDKQRQHRYKQKAVPIK